MEINSISRDGRTFTGPQAVGVFQAATLWASLGLYEKTGIKPTRGVGLKRMMELASAITGKTFKASQAQIPAAREALHLLIEASKAALVEPATD